MGIFNVDGTRDDKMKFLFKMFDLDGDGCVDFGDFECVLMLICGPEITDEEAPAHMLVYGCKLSAIDRPHVRVCVMVGVRGDGESVCLCGH